jgi:ankyrin repeat protein
LSDEKNRNPLHCAVWAQNIEALRLVIEHYPQNSLPFLLNQKTAAGKTPLHEAAVNGFCDIAALLILHGADVNSVCTFKKRTPLLDCLRSHKKSLIHADTKEEYDKKFKARLSTEQVISFCKELKKAPVAIDLSVKDIYQIDPREAINRINFDTADEKQQLEKVIFGLDNQ